MLPVLPVAASHDPQMSAGPSPTAWLGPVEELIGPDELEAADAEATERTTSTDDSGASARWAGALEQLPSASTTVTSGGTIASLRLVISTRRRTLPRPGCVSNR